MAVFLMADQLRDADGRSWGETTLSTAQRDPRLEAIVFDLQSPADPFTPGLFSRLCADHHPTTWAGGFPSPRDDPAR
jgi:hypothetical protein